MNEFKNYNPFSLLLFSLMAIALTMTIIQPVYLCLSLLFAIIFNVRLNGIIKMLKSLLFYFIIFLVVVLTNMLFVHKGISYLLFINGNAITVEAMIYGMCMALMLISLLIWLKNISLIIDNDKFIYLFGSFMPVIGLTLSMIFRFIPLMQKQLKKIYFFIKINQKNEVENRKGLLNLGIQSFLSLLVYSFENGIDTINSMNARGYGSGKRTYYHNYYFEGRDIVFILISTVLLIVTIYCYLDYNYNFNIYPNVSGLNGFDKYYTYLPFAFLLLLPLIIEWKEDIKWQLLKSKI